MVAVVALFLLIFSTAACSLMEELELTVPGVTHLAMLTTLTGCALVAYAGCVLRDAGPVPPHWQPDTESPSQVSWWLVSTRNPSWVANAFRRSPIARTPARGYDASWVCPRVAPECARLCPRCALGWLLGVRDNLAPGCARLCPGCALWKLLGVLSGSSWMCSPAAPGCALSKLLGVLSGGSWKTPRVAIGH